MARTNQHQRGESHERSPLIPQRSPTSYGTSGPVPHSPGSQPPPPHEVTDSDEDQTTTALHQQSDSLPLYLATFAKYRPAKFTGRWCIGAFVVFLVIVAQVVTLIFLSSKFGEYTNAAARLHEERGAMVEETKHLESERIAFQSESDRLERERLALDSTTRRMLVEKEALESAIRRSELERSRLEKEKQLLEDERHALAQEKEELKEERGKLREEKEELMEVEERLREAEERMREAEVRLREERGKLREEREELMEIEEKLKEEKEKLREERGKLREERERWEKAREDRVPQGAFWGALTPAEDCRSYGTREYKAVLQNIPEDWTDVDACMNMPVTIKGVDIRRPLRCESVEDSPHIQATWMVDWDQPDCKPWHNEIIDRVSATPSHPTSLPNANFKGCTNSGSGVHRLEARVRGINHKPAQDWRLLCETTPMTWNHTTYNAPTHCKAGVSTIFICFLGHLHILTGDLLEAVWEEICIVGYS